MPANLIDRAIYFAPIIAANQTIDPSGTIYYSDLQQMAPLLPGRYAVVGGSGDDTGPGSGVYETTFGRRSDADEGTRLSLKTDSTRRIVFTPTANPATNQVRINSNKTSGSDDPPQIPEVQPEIAIVINKPRSLSLTEPKDGYPGATWQQSSVAYCPGRDLHAAGARRGWEYIAIHIPFDNNPQFKPIPICNRN